MPTHGKVGGTVIRRNALDSSTSHVRVRPDGVLLMPLDLPPADTKRWVTRRKAAVAAAVESGLLSLEEACRKYGMSAEELKAWRLALKEFGPKGLQTTKNQRRGNIRTSGS